jgi:crossover junction endodeoxyribonuclease RusA
MAVILKLPWPEPQCWPNRIKNRFTRQAARKRARSLGRCAAIRGGVIMPDGDLLAIMRFHAPTRRAFDVDNAIAAMKGHLDGAFEACGADDGVIKAALGVRCGKGPTRRGLVIIEFRPFAAVSDWLRRPPSSLLD